MINEYVVGSMNGIRAVELPQSTYIFQFLIYNVAHFHSAYMHSARSSFDDNNLSHPSDRFNFCVQTFSLNRRKIVLKNDHSCLRGGDLPDPTPT